MDVASIDTLYGLLVYTDKKAQISKMYSFDFTKSWGEDEYHAISKEHERFVYEPHLKRRQYRWLVFKSNFYNQFLEEVYGIENNIELYRLREQVTFSDFIEAFEDWYKGKKEKFMEKQTLEMAKANLKEFKKTSHSGVAALLNTLTKTMEKQGADIRSIARVQYAVCVQAGIYLPEEFLLDVAIALDSSGEGEAEEIF